MSTIDQKVVEMRFDNKQFESGINQSMNSLDKLKASLKFDNAIDNATLTSIGNGVDWLASRFSFLGEVLMGVKMKAAQTLKSLTIDQVAAGWQKYADLTEATQKIMSATRKDWKDQTAQMAYVNEQIEKLNWFTDETSYNLTDMTSNIGKFTSAGIKLDKATTSMIGIANWAGISGAKTEEASRAMYNLSQAMSMGSLQLKDWMSIENANMATREFKDEAIKAGLACGSLKKASDGTVYALDRFKKRVTVTNENFRNTLSTGWLNTKVLNTVLDKYGSFTNELHKILSDGESSIGEMMSTSQVLKYVDQVKKGVLNLKDTQAVGKLARDLGVDAEELTKVLGKLSDKTLDLGYNAFKASQEAKTFEDAINYAKDAASTGWMNTIKAFAGDYLQAKELWTGLTEEIYDVLIEDVDKQNAVLKAWGKLGGREVLLEAISTTWQSVKFAIMAIKDSFREVFPPQTADTLLAIVERFNKLSYVLSLTESQVDKIRDLFGTFFRGIKNITNGIKNFGEVIVEALDFADLLPKDFFKEGAWYDRIKELVDEFYRLTYVFELTKSDANKFLPVLKSIFHFIDSLALSIKNTAQAAMKAFRNIFKNNEFELLDGFANAITNITDALVINEERAEQLQKIFEALFSIIDIGKMLLEAILEPILGLTDTSYSFADAILMVTTKIAEWIISVRDWIKEHDAFRKAVNAVINFFKNLKKNINDAAIALTGMSIGEIFEKIKEAALNAWEYIKTAFSQAKEDLGILFGKLKDVKTGSEDAGSSVTIFEKIRDTIEKLKEGFQILKPYIDEFFDTLKNGKDFEWPTAEEFGDGMVKGGQLAVLASLTAVFIEFFKMIKDGRGLTKSIKGVFETISGSIKTLTNTLKDKIKAETFKTIATSILELAAAILIISIIPEDKMNRATAAVVFMMAELAAAFQVIGRVKTSKDKLEIIRGMLGMLELIMATLIAGIFLIATQTDIGNATTAAIMIAGLFAEVGVFMAAMTKVNFTKAQAEKLNELFKTVAILIAAIGVSIAAAASGGNWQAITAAGTVMGGMLMAIAGALNIMPKVDNLKELAGALALVSASMVLLGMGIMLATSGGDWTAIGAAGVVMSGMVLAIAGALKMLAGEDVLKGAAAITVVAVGVVLLAGALAVLSGMNMEQAGIALLALAGALTAILVAGAVAGKVAVGLEALGIAFALIGVGVLAAGTGMWLFADALEKIVGLGSSGVDVFISGLNAFFENLPMYASNAGDAVINFIEKIAGAKETLIRGIETVLTAILQALINVTPKILELAVTIITGLLNSLVEIMPSLMEFLRELFTNVITLIWEQTPVIVDTVIMITKELLRSLREIVPDITKTLMFILTDTLTQIRDNIEQIISLSVEIGILTVTGFLKGLIEQIPNIVDTGIEFVLALINGIADGIEEHAEDMRKTMENLVTSLINAFCTLLGINSPSTIFEGFGDNIVQGLINGIGSMIESAKKKITELADKVLTAICDFFGIDKPKDKDELLQVGVKIIQKFNQGIWSMIDKAKKMICDLADKVLTAICNFFGIDKPKDKQEFYKLGLNIINAFKDAISSLTNKVKSAVEGVANAAISKFKSVLGIKSPSKVFMQFGEYVDEGFAIGLRDNTDMVADSALSVGNKAIDTMASVLSGISNMIDEEMEDPTIKPVLDLSDITSGLGEMDDMLSAQRAVNLSSYADNAMNEQIASHMSLTDALEQLKEALGDPDDRPTGDTINNTFNITGNNPREIAEEVSRIMQTKVERKGAAWGT